jgi:hypothetical protein
MVGMRESETKIHAHCCEHAASHYAISIQLSSLLSGKGGRPLKQFNTAIACGLKLTILYSSSFNYQPAGLELVIQ